MKNPFKLPESHWALAKNKLERVKRMILYNYDLRNIINICKVESKYIESIAKANDLHLRDRGVSTMREFIDFQHTVKPNEE